MSSEETPVTKHCGNCRSDIASKSFMMHALHCQRFIKYCDYCDEPFPKSEWDEHEKTNHGDVTCKDCGNPVEKKLYENHLKDECTSRPMTCTFCEVPHPMSKLEEHENYCGSRTEHCPGCLKYVMIRYFDTHICEVSEPQPFTDCTTCDEYTEEYDNHTYDDFERFNINDDEGHDSSGTDEFRLPCEFCDSLFGFDELFEHQNDCVNQFSSE